MPLNGSNPSYFWGLPPSLAFPAILPWFGTLWLSEEPCPDPRFSFSHHFARLVLGEKVAVFAC